jgi:hypothetical protein
MGKRSEPYFFDSTHLSSQTPVNAFIPPDTGGNIYFDAQGPAKSFFFEIEYETGSGQTEIKKFRFELGTSTPVEIE